MNRVLVGMVAVTGLLTGSAASAAQADDTQARVEALEKENAAFRREIAALRENRLLRERTAASKLPEPHPQGLPASSDPAPKRDPFGAYAADMAAAYKARPVAEPRGQLRLWGEGGAIWTGGDPVSSNYRLADFSSLATFGNGNVFGGPAGILNLMPKIGWEAATGFDYRFAASPWHVSGQLRYGESGKASGSASSAGSIDPLIIAAIPLPPGTVIGGSETYSANYRETHWLADLAVGRDVIGDSPSAMQVKLGLRLSEFVGNTNVTDVVNAFERLPAPRPFGGIPLSFISNTVTSEFALRSSFLGAGPRIGIDGSVPFAGNWSFDYQGDAAALFGYQRLVNTQVGNSVTVPVFLNQLGLVGLLGGGGSFVASATDQRFATVFNADIQLGISYWMTQNLKLSASYRLDAYFNVLNQTFATSSQTSDRYIHGPRFAVTAQF
jgi:Legionella pneumophila major outer membrane protein precursor